MVVEVVARRYGITPGQAAKEPYWTLDHVHDMAQIDKAVAEQQAAAEPAPEEPDY